MSKRKRYAHNPGPTINEGVVLPPDDPYLGQPDLGAIAWDALVVHPVLKTATSVRPVCIRCKGRGYELTLLECWDDLAMTLRCYQWPEDALSRLKEQLRPEDMLVAARMFSVEIERGARHITFNRT